MLFTCPWTSRKFYYFHTPALCFIEVDDDDDEDDEGDWEEGAEELIDKKSTYEGPTARELESNRRLNEMLKYVKKY